MPEDIKKIEEKLNYSFKKPELLERAITHKSAISQKESNDYERLEFLGDAVFDLVVAHLLSDNYSEAREGELSKRRAALVNTESLAHFAKKIELGSKIKMGKAEKTNGGEERSSILADVMEAVVGALYLDGGYNEAHRVIKNLIGDKINTVSPSDPKTELQEVLHAKGLEIPEYLLECVEGPEHAPNFISIVKIDGKVAGRGEGNTKKYSQQQAAAEALDRILEEEQIKEEVKKMKERERK